MTSLSSMTDAEKTAYAEKLEEKLQSRMIKIAHYNRCVLIEIAATLALNQFQKKYTRVMINRSTLLQEEEDRLIAAKTKAWNDRFAAESEAYPPTLESILWIVAKSGFTLEVAPLMNLSKATRECKNLQRVMREVMNRSRWGGQTQLHYCCEHGMTSSVVRMLEMRSIDVEARERGGYRRTCLHTAAQNGHLAICRLLIDKGAQLEAKDVSDMTPLHWAAIRGHVEIVRLLCDRGADIEARCYDGLTPLHWASRNGHISVVKELIEERNAEINARFYRGWTALRLARQENKPDVAAYLVSHGGIV
jgi:hypothetical protein